MGKPSTTTRQSKLQGSWLAFFVKIPKWASRWFGKSVQYDWKKKVNAHNLNKWWCYRCGSEAHSTQKSWRVFRERGLCAHKLRERDINQYNREIGLCRQALHSHGWPKLLTINDFGRAGPPKCLIINDLWLKWKKIWLYEKMGVMYYYEWFTKPNSSL